MTGTDTDRSALYLDLHIKIDNEGRLNKTLRYKITQDNRKT
jgi:hypothetical protein